jgi:hypothetical protein
MTPLNREKAARKLCQLRGLPADHDVMRFSADGSIGDAVPRWQLVADEIDHIYKILQAINETLEEG